MNFPSNFDTGNNAGGPTHLPLVALSPIIHPRIREVRTGLGSSARKGTVHLKMLLQREFDWNIFFMDVFSLFTILKCTYNCVYINIYYFFYSIFIFYFFYFICIYLFFFKLTDDLKANKHRLKTTTPHTPPPPPTKLNSNAVFEY